MLAGGWYCPDNCLAHCVTRNYIPSPSPFFLLILYETTISALFISLFSQPTIFCYQIKHLVRGDRVFFFGYTSSSLVLIIIKKITFYYKFVSSRE